MKKLILILLLPVFVGGTDVVNFGSDTPGTVPKRWSVLMTPQGGAPKWVLSMYGQDKSPLKLIQKVPMPNVKGRLDHFAVDLEGRRLFVAALGDDQNTVEVIDLKMGKRIFSIPGQSKPQGVFYSPDFKKLFVANGTDGTCKIFAGDTFKLIDNLPIGTDADHVGYDPAAKYLYVGFGDVKSGGLALPVTHKALGTKVIRHPPHYPSL